MKILAVKLRAIGDTVLWTAALAGLKKSFPAAEIHVLTYATNTPVLEHNPDVHQLHTLPANGHKALLKQLWSLRKQKFDWLLGFHATTSLCRWAWIVGAEKMALHHHSWAETPRGSVPVPHAGALESALWRDHRLLEAMGSTQPLLATRISLTAEERDRAEQKVVAAIATVGGDATLPRYLFLPGASHHLRRLPKDRWLALTDEALSQGYQPVVMVDAPLSQELALASECQRRNLPLLDQSQLREFIALLACGHKALANDSGPGHMAVAVGVPTSFVFGPGCVGDWHPYDRRQHPLFRLAVDCRAQGPRDREEFQFCTLDTCSHHRCMREVVVAIT